MIVEDNNSNQNRQNTRADQDHTEDRRKNSSQAGKSAEQFRGNPEIREEDGRFADLSKTKRKLAQMKKSSAEREAAEYAKKIGYPYLDLNIFPITAQYVNLIPKEKAKKARVTVIHLMNKKIILGAADPLNELTQEIINDFKKKGYQVKVFVVSEYSLAKAWEAYDQQTLVEKFNYLRLSLTGDDLKQFEEELNDLVELGERIKEMPTTKLLGIIVAGAIKLDASDIHFEPQNENEVRLRYRIDGVLHEVVSLDKSVYPSLVARIKILGGMMLNVYDVAQDGRFSIKISDDEKIDVRVSILPGNYGENIVLRLLYQDITKLSLEKLGLIGKNYKWLVEEAEKKQGMIINSGPTGSGKTTTLYSLINRIKSEEKKIISIEDPIEYQIPGIQQTQVEERRGYTFATGLRAIVRQDPDVILVGEIRDEETAEIAINAALTGHLVLTTVHANTAAGVPGRLVDLGIKSNIVAIALNVVIAQRLVRRLCKHCREKYQPAPETEEALKEMLSLISPKAEIEIPKKIEYLYRPRGCVQCRGLGYKGRIGIFEVMRIDKDIQKLIENLATEHEIRNAALEKGMITYEQDGILKALRGDTSLEEVQRVTGRGEYLLNLYEEIMIQTLARGMRIAPQVVKEIQTASEDYRQIGALIKKAESMKKLAYILAAGVMMKAGDIHIEPGEKEFKIKYRIDGILHDIAHLPMDEFLTVLNKVKELIGAKIQKREGVTDGRFRIILPTTDETTAENKVDVRVSIILGGYGDIIVLRLLNQTAQAIELDKLGLREFNLLKLKKNIHQPNGVFLNTGPTGSGKTTTLYSALKSIARPELKIITVEDPIEYQLDGILQTQVNKKEKYTFATALRNLLRQNPDVIMVGEIRDEETARLVYQAALTGHLVLSTLHSNSAAGAVRRLANMKVRLVDIASGSNAFMAQRLIRVLCSECKQPVVLSSAEREQVERVLQSISPATKLKIPKESEYQTFRAVGCQQCHGLGYRGRVPIAEVLEVDEEMERFIATDPTTADLHQKAVERGMLTMGQDGALRIVEGVTTLEEVARVTEELEKPEEQ